jgi:IS30 family transposase
MEDLKGHLSYPERSQIWKYKKLGYGVRQIARELGRSESTISRELRRNANDGVDWAAKATQAHELTKSRRTQANESRIPLKSIRIQLYVEQKLKDKWSPELIALRLRFENSDVTVSHEAIYQWIREERPDLIQYLKVAGKFRRRRRGKKAYKPKQPAAPKTSIDERPAHIGTREEVGHWEGDLMVSRQSRPVLLHLRERQTRLSKLVKLPDAKAETAKLAVVAALGSYPNDIVRTLTLDNGSENALHDEMSAALGLDVYFAHPYCAWEKGTIENGNGSVRWDLPKKTDFALITESRIQQIEDRLNNRPMKCLGGMTPLEAMNKVLLPATH